MNDKVIYFSLSLDRKNSFYDFIKEAGICYKEKFSFDLVGGEKEFKDPRDLLSLIESQDKKDSLHIIIDYVSCCGTGKEINYSTVLRNIIMCFPEVQFLFDETFVNKQKILLETENDKLSKVVQYNFNFLNFLFWDAGGKDLSEDEIRRGKPDVFNIVMAEYHQFYLTTFNDVDINKQFILMLKGRNNLFDASNLRYAIKKQKFYELSVQDNYPNLNESRRNHVAVVVEEEYHQAQFNSYCLFSNGFRVFPVICASELLWINNTIEQRVNHNIALFIEKELKEFQRILNGSNISEQDLTRFNEETKKDGEKRICELNDINDIKEALDFRLKKEYDAIYSMKKQWNDNHKNRVSILNCFKAELSKKLEDQTMLIRDYDLQFIDENIVNSGVKTDKESGRNEVDYIRGAKKNKENGYVLIDDNGDKDKNPYWKSLYKGTTYFVSKGDDQIIVQQDFPKSMNEKNKPKLELRGIKKPLEGIYAWAHRIPAVNRRYKESRDTNSGKFETGRLGEGGHSCPLDIYGVVRPMVHRAEMYYHKEHRYRLAALVSGEALGILNGFHKSLMNEAYYIQAISENAMAMSLLGGNENMLKEDIRLRLKEKVKKEVERMIPDPTGQKNLLYNIFNDCLLFCQEKEYFNAADEALSIMVNEKDGIDIIKLFKKLFKKKQKT